MRARLLVLAAVSLAACNRQDPAPNKPSPPGATAAPEAKKLRELSVDEVEARMKAATASIYDANPREVFDKRHVPGATWVEFDGVTAELLPKDKERALVFYCANER